MALLCFVNAKRQSCERNASTEKKSSRQKKELAFLVCYTCTERNLGAKGKAALDANPQFPVSRREKTGFVNSRENYCPYFCILLKFFKKRLERGKEEIGSVRQICFPAKEIERESSRVFQRKLGTKAVPKREKCCWNKKMVGYVKMKLELFFLSEKRWPKWQ